MKKNFASNKSERDFGLLIGGIILVICLYKYMAVKSINLYVIAFSLLLITVAFIKPRWLNQPRRYWEKFSYYLGVINTTLLLSVIYIMVFAPLGVLFKLTGRDFLERKFQKKKQTYWQERDERASSLNNQF
jgi:hypothetical protein